MRWMIRIVLVSMALAAFALGHEPTPHVAVAEPTTTAPSTDGARQDAISIPVVGVTAGQLRPSFNEGRVGHIHHALDILAPRGTAVIAAVDGRIEKLFTSGPGGLTIYEFDRARQFVYYYAHLDRYAPSIAEGMEVTRGTVIGYVGTTGNAPANTPHLHFAIQHLGPEKRWWQATAIDPYGVLVGSDQ
jgi:peptidoglycan LD-endopeptidase LytH